MYGRWTYRGTVLGLLLAIAYNTRAQSAVIEGGFLNFGRLSFQDILLCGLGGAAAGFVGAAIIKAPKSIDRFLDS